MDNNFESNFKIVVLGIGGAGSNIISTLLEDQKPGLEIALVNTDVQDLNSRPKEVSKIQIGPNTTNGQGAGSKPEIGQKAAEESQDILERQVQGANIVFSVFGLGGGTGTGAGPLIAKYAKENNALSIVLATMPDHSEGQKVIDRAKEGANKLESYSDSYTLFSNEKLVAQSSGLSYEQAYKKIDGQITQSIRTIWNMITNTGKKNIDLADVRNALQNAGKTIIAMGSCSGDVGPEDAVNQAVDNPLFEGTIKGCKKAIVNIVANPKADMLTTNRVVEQIKKVSFSQDIDITNGLTYDESLNDEIFISIIATQLSEDDDLDDTYTQRKMANNIMRNAVEGIDSEIPQEVESFSIESYSDSSNKTDSFSPKVAQENQEQYLGIKSNQESPRNPRWGYVWKYWSLI